MFAKLVTCAVVVLAFGALAVEVKDGKFQTDEREQKALKHCADTGDQCAIIARAELQAYVGELRAAWEAEIVERFQSAARAEGAKICKNTI